MKLISVKSISINLLFAILFVLTLSLHGYTQVISATDKKKLAAKEDTLQIICP